MPFAGMKLSRLIDLMKPYINLLRFQSFDTSSEVGRSYERYRLIALSGSSSFFSKIIISLTGLISVPLTINYLGKEQFGLWMVISSLVIWLQLTDFGIGNGLINALAEANGRNDKESACSYFTTAFCSITVITFILFAPVVMAAFFIPWDSVLNLESASLLHDANLCFIIVAIFFFINMPLSLANKALGAYQKGYLVNITQVAASLSSLLFLIIAISMGLTLPWLVSFVSAGAVFGNALSWIFLHREIPWLKLQLNKSSREALRRVARSSVPLFLFQFGALLLNQTANIILAQFGGLGMVADYNILAKFYSVIFSIGTSLSFPFYPAIREAFERKEKRWIYHAIKRVTTIRLSSLIVPTIPLIFIGNHLILLWIRQPLSENFGYAGWSCFLLCIILAGLSSTLSEILIVLDYIYTQLHSLFINALVFILCCILLVPHFGLTGFYASSIIGMAYPTLWILFKTKSVLTSI